MHGRLLRCPVVWPHAEPHAQRPGSRSGQLCGTEDHAPPTGSELPDLDQLERHPAALGVGPRQADHRLLAER